MVRTQGKRANHRAGIARTSGIYSRVSLLDPRLSDDEVESIQSQDEECREACDEHDWPVHRLYSDPGISASEYAKVKIRPDWQQLVADVEAGVLQVVVLWESSRGDRKPEEWIGFLNLCKRVDCLIHIMSHDEYGGGVTYTMDNPDHFDKLAREGLDNAKESHKTSGRLRRLKRRRRAKGMPDGTYPFGFRRVYDDRTGKIVRQEPDPEAAAVVRRAFALLASQMPSKQVSQETGRSPRWLHLMVDNKSYISIIEHDGEEYPAQWRPVLYVPGKHREGCDNEPPCPGCVPDTATFYKVFNIYAARRLNRDRPNAVKYLLSNIAECGVDGCDAVVSVQPAKTMQQQRGDKVYTINAAAKYACQDGHFGINMEDVDTHVSAVIVAYYSKPGRYDQLIKTDDTEVLAAQAEIDRIKAELADLQQRARSGRVSLDLAESFEQGLLDQLERATAQRQSVVPPAVRDLMEGPVEELAQRWVDMPLPGQREIVRATLRVVIHPAGGKGRRVPVADRAEVLPVGAE